MSELLSDRISNAGVKCRLAGSNLILEVGHGKGGNVDKIHCLQNIGIRRAGVVRGDVHL